MPRIWNVILAFPFVLALTTTNALGQIPASEYAARRDSLAARIGDGVVVGFGGRTPVADFGPFYQLPAFHYLTNFDEPDAAFVMTVRGGRGTTTVFLTPIDPRRAFYYGRRPDSASVERSGMKARSFGALAGFVDSLAATGATFYHLTDFEDEDFAREDSLTRGRVVMAGVVARHPTLQVKDAHAIVDQLRARKSPAELALLSAPPRSAPRVIARRCSRRSPRTSTSSRRSSSTPSGDSAVHDPPMGRSSARERTRHSCTT